MWEVLGLMRCEGVGEIVYVHLKIQFTKLLMGAHGVHVRVMS